MEKVGAVKDEVVISYKKNLPVEFTNRLELHVIVRKHQSRIQQFEIVLQPNRLTNISTQIIPYLTVDPQEGHVRPSE